MWIARLITRLASEWGSAGKDRMSELRARRPLLPKAHHNSRDNYLVLPSNNTRRSLYITTANCASLALTQYDGRLVAAKLFLHVMMMWHLLTPAAASIRSVSQHFSPHPSACPPSVLLFTLFLSWTSAAPRPVFPCGPASAIFLPFILPAPASINMNELQPELNTQFSHMQLGSVYPMHPMVNDDYGKPKC